jgi:methyl-accepting chemotaxis protein
MINVTAPVDKEQIITDQLRRQREQLTLTISKYVAGGTALLVLIIVLMSLFIKQNNQLYALAGVTGPLIVTAGIYPLFHRRDRATTGTFILLISIMLTISLGIIIMPEIRLGTAIGFILIIILGNMLLSGRDSWWMVAACVLTFGLDIVAIARWRPDWFQPLDPQIELIINLTLSATSLFIGAILIRLISRGQEQSFRDAQLARLEIEKRAHSEQSQKEYLQLTIGGYVDYMAKIRQGNLALRIPLNNSNDHSEDPLVVLGNQINQTITSLQAMISSLRTVAQQLNSVATEILAATTQQASSASEQSSAVAQTTATVDEVKTIAEQASLRASEMTEVSRRTVDVAQSGQLSVQQSIASMQLIQERVEKIAENILALSDRTQQIGNIIDSVNEIASQSNMLALNASIEAARAGEHGKGFAVVAQEVRDLSEQSRQATEQIKAILLEIQKATNSTVMATEEGTKGVNQGVRLAAGAQQAIEQLSGSISEAAQMAMQLTAGGQQQVAGMVQIALAITNIHQATLQSLTSTRQAENAAQALHELAGNLIENIEQYQV